MKLLITGANGYLGSALKRDLSTQFTVRGTYGKNRKQYLLPMDVTNEEQVISTLQQETPDVIINCVGISGKFKKNPSYAALVNIEGTQNIVKGAQDIGASIIHISSTAVFNGRDGPFTEEDPPGSFDEYAQTKIEAERIVQTSELSQVIIRPSLIVGESPYGMEDKFPGHLVKAISTGIPLEVDNEWRFAPSYTRHLANVTSWWINNQERARLLHVAAPEAITKFQFARRLCRELGIKPDVFQEKERTGHAGDNILDSSRLSTLGAPTISLNDIIRETASEIRNPQMPEGQQMRTKERY